MKPKKKMMMNESLRDRARSLLQRPYSRLVTPEDDGSFFAHIREFEGCVAIGSSARLALESLEDVACSWIEGMLASGQKIPDPIVLSDFSGKFVVRLPKSLHKQAVEQASRDGVSLNMFVTSCIAQHVGCRTAESSVARMLSGMVIVTSAHTKSAMHLSWPSGAEYFTATSSQRKSVLGENFTKGLVLTGHAGQHDYLLENRT